MALDPQAERDMEFLLSFLITFVEGMEALGLFDSSDIPLIGPFFEVIPWQLNIGISVLLLARALFLCFKYRDI